MILANADMATAFSGLIGFGLVIILSVLGIMWILFPIFVFSRLGAIEKSMREMHRMEMQAAELRTQTLVELRCHRLLELERMAGESNKWMERADELLQAIEKNTRK